MFATTSSLINQCFPFDTYSQIEVYNCSFQYCLEMPMHWILWNNTNIIFFSLRKRYLEMTFKSQSRWIHFFPLLKHLFIKNPHQLKKKTFRSSESPLYLLYFKMCSGRISNATFLSSGAKGRLLASLLCLQCWFSKRISFLTCAMKFKFTETANPSSLTEAN